MESVFVFTRIKALIVLFFLLDISCAGAGPDSLSPAPSLRLPAPVFSALLQIQQVQSFSDSFDIQGKFSTEPIPNAFVLRRARCKARWAVDKHWTAYAMANLAELASKPAGPVLELAWIGYRASDAFQLTAGLHRPLWGIEDLYGNEEHRSIDWSRQYTAFGRSGWQSFQLGVSVQGHLREGSPLPVFYALGLHNGNGRQLHDSDGGKHAYARLAFDLPGGARLGLNGALGRSRECTGHAYAVDVLWNQTLSDRWSIRLEAEYKEGSNLEDFCRDFDANPEISIGDYRMRGLLLLPDLCYRPKQSDLRALEFSLRGEWLDDHVEGPYSADFALTPQLSFSFAEDYAVRFQLAFIEEWTRASAPDAAIEAHGRMIAQLQIRL